MNSRFLLVLLVSATFALRAAADEPAKEETPPPKQATKEEIEARLAEHHRRREAKTASEQEAAAKAAEEAKATSAATAAPVATDPATKAAVKNQAKDTAQVLPKVDVRKERITELDIQLQKQNAEIAREKANAKPTVLDETLNGPGISKALALFGGQSSEDRANIAKERLAMMEDEKDVLQAISQARTKEEKAELEKLLAMMRDTRRELENSLR